jgi:glycerol uptake facilitator-like aquaporin
VETLATGAVLVVLITMFGAISGAHFNPAVSLVATMDGDLSPSSFTIYVLAQIVGAIAGVWLAHAMFDLPIVQLSQTVRTGAGQWISEVVATFGLVLSILLTVRHRPDFVAVVVGLYITSAYWFTASTSFANPAVTIARTLTNTFAGIAPGDAAPFIAAQIAGAVLGLAAARVFRR